MSGQEKKQLLIRLLDEAREFMDEFLKEDLENAIDYNDPELQRFLYALAVILRDLMVIAKKLRQSYDNDLEDGGMTLILNFLLEKIDELWPEKGRKS